MKMVHDDYIIIIIFLSFFIGKLQMNDLVL